MKKFVFVLGLFFVFSMTAKAELYHGNDVDLLYQYGDFKSKAEIKKMIDNFSQLDINYDPEKNTVSNVIDRYYEHPEYTPLIEAKCKESMEWIKGKFGLWEEPNFRANMCLTWETNKKLNKKQIELLAHLSKTWEDVIGDLHQNNDVDASYNRQNEYSLQLATRMYNLVTKQKWPECYFETGNSSDYHLYDKEPCNAESAIIHECRKSHNLIVCMQEKLINAMSGLVQEEYKNIVHEDIVRLLHLTEETIAEIEANKSKQNSEIVRLYNFYWISIHKAYEVISLFARKSVE